MICERCGSTFEPNKMTPGQKYCSKRCGKNALAAKYRAQRKAPVVPPRVCVICGNSYVPHFRAHNSMTCSHVCGYKHRLNQARIYQREHYADKKYECRYISKMPEYPGNWSLSRCPFETGEVEPVLWGGSL